VADAAASAVPTVTGTFRIPAGASVELRNIPDAPGSLWIPVVAAAAFNGDMVGVVYAGDELQPPFRAWLRVRDGVLGVRVSGRGTFLSFR
jgi:hypothetical protein